MLEESAISEKLHKALGVGFADRRKMTVGTAGKSQTLTKLGRSNQIRIRIDGMKRRLLITPTVIPGLSDGLNLGSGFFQKLGMDSPTVIEFRGNTTTLQIGKERTELVQSMAEETRGRGEARGRSDAGKKRETSVPERVQKLHASRNQRVKAQTLTFVEVETSTMAPGGTVYVAPREGKTMETVGAIYKWKRSKNRIAVLNTTDRDVIVQGGTAVGTGELIDPCRKPTERVSRMKESEEEPEDLEAHIETILEGLKIMKNPLLAKNPKIRDKLIELVRKYWRIFGEPGLTTGLTDLMEFDIELKPGTKPHRAKVRPLNPAQMESLKKQMKLWLDEDVIEPSNSAWASALVPAKKKGGLIRWAIDYRILNDATVADSYPLPSIEENLERLAGAKVFSALDAAAAYNTIPVSERSKPLLAFITPLGLFTNKRMPFGPKNSGAVYSRFISMLLEDLRSPYVIAYLDDILAFTKDLEQQLVELEGLFEMHRKAGIKLRPHKTKLFTTEAEYLGFKVSPNGVEMQDDYVARILEWPEPTTVKELNTFLGFTGYYRAFIKEYATLTRDMNGQRKEKKLTWTEQMSADFRELKEKFKKKPIRAYPRYDLDAPFQVTTDFSAKALGGVLSQEQDGQERMIGCAARKCTLHEKNYPSVKGELAAVIYAFRKWEHILKYRRFRLNTDSQALKYLKTLKQPSGIWFRWLQELSSYDFEVRHIAGKLNKNADALSRADHHPPPTEDERKEEEEDYIAELLQAIQELDEEEREERVRKMEEDPRLRELQEQSQDLTREGLKRIQRADPIIQEVIHWVQAGKRPDKKSIRREEQDLKVYWQLFDSLQMRDEVLYYPVQLNAVGGDEVWRVVLPRARGDVAYKWSHEHLTAGHFGVTATLQRALQRFYYVGMYADLTSRVKACPTCVAKQTRINTKKGIHRPVATGYPGEVVCIDLVGPLPETHDHNRYILTVEDVFTKYCSAIPIPNKNATTVARALMDEYLSRYGMPTAIKSDNGKEFVNTVLEELMDRLRIGKKQTPVYNPHSNPVERFHRTLNQMLRTHMEKEDAEWSRILPAIMMAYNSKVHSTTGVTPFCAYFGREMRMPIDLVITPPERDTVQNFVASIVKRYRQIYDYIRRKTAASIRRSAAGYMGAPRHYKVGAKVWYLCPRKIGPRPAKHTDSWLGPYKVVKKVADVIYKISPLVYSGPAISVHEQRLLPWTEGSTKYRMPTRLRTDDRGDELGEELRAPGPVSTESTAIPLTIDSGAEPMLDIMPGSAIGGADQSGPTQQNGEFAPDDSLEEHVGAPTTQHEVADSFLEPGTDRDEGPTAPPIEMADTVEPTAPPAEEPMPGPSSEVDRRNPYRQVSKQLKRQAEQEASEEAPRRRSRRTRTAVAEGRTKNALERAILGGQSSSDETIGALTVVIDQDSVEPKRGSADSACFDVCAAERVSVPNSLRAGKPTPVPLRLAAAIPPGYMIKLQSRSGLALKGLWVIAGVIDADYRDKIAAIMVNIGDTFVVQKGQRICQMEVRPVVDCVFKREDVLPAATSHHEGFGSTGLGGADVPGDGASV